MRSILIAPSIGTAPAETSGMVLENSTAAADGAQQFSPSVFIRGQAWNSGAAASQPVAARFEVQPVQGNPPTFNILLSASINGGAYSTICSFTSVGALNLSAGLAASSDITSTTDIRAAGALWADGFDMLINSADQSTGLGAASNFISGNAEPLVVQSAQSSGAGNRSVVLSANVNAASIDADHKPFSVGWRNDSSVFSELLSLLGDGRLNYFGGMALDPNAGIPVWANAPSGFSSVQTKWLKVAIGGINFVIPTLPSA